MRQIRKVPFKDLRGEKLTKPELKFILGGYDLGEVVVECSGYGFGVCYYSCYNDNGPYHCCASGDRTETCYVG